MRPPARAVLPAELITAVRAAASDRTAAARERLVESLQGAVDAYNRGRYEEAARRISPVVQVAPTVAGLREVAGLACYRARRWRSAIEHLRAYAELTNDVTHTPAWMDCERALGHPRNVARLFEQVRGASPSPEVLSEARIVLASSFADRGELARAIDLLVRAGADRRIRNPADRHVRQWYVLADLFERTGDVPRARELFTRVAMADPGAYDVEERIEELGGRTPTASRRRAR